MAENLAELPALKDGQEVIMPIDQPIKSSGHIQVSFNQPPYFVSILHTGSGSATYRQGPGALWPTISTQHASRFSRMICKSSAASAEYVSSRDAMMQILYGNLAPEGSVAKITGKEGLQFRGPARVFDSEEDMLAVVAEDPQQLKVLTAWLEPAAYGCRNRGPRRGVRRPAVCLLA